MKKRLPPVLASAESFAIEARAVITAAVAGADGAPKGRPSVEINAYGGGAIRVAGYKNPVVIDLEGLSGVGKSIPLFRNHDSERIVGHGIAARDGNSLKLNGKLSAINADAEQITSLAAEEFPWQASVGVQPIRLEEVKAGSSAEVNGQSISGPVSIVRAGKLYEISIVANGADDTTSTKVAAQIPVENIMGFSAWLTKKGLVEADLSASQMTALQAMFAAEGDEGNSPSVDAVLQAARDKASRGKAYGRIVEAALERGLDADTAERLVQAATKDGLSETEFELQILRLQRHTGSTRVASQHGSDSPEIIEAALARQIGGDIEGQFKPEVLEASERQFKYGLSLVEVLSLSARRNGYHAASHRDLKPLLRAAFAPVQAATGGASTYDLGGVLSNVANKMIRAGFDSVDSSWRKIASIKTVNDLKEHKSFSLTGDFSYQEVGKGGELTHATMSEVEYANRARTYGRMFAITEDDLINDDLNAFTRVRNLLGRGSALSMNKVIWTEFLANASTFWTALRGNYMSGAPSALDVDSLSVASTMFEDQTDPDGNPLGLSPAVLVVPSALKIQAGRLAKDTELRIDGSSAKTTYLTSNPHASKFEVAASTYMNNAAIPGGSATHWMLIADPLDMSTIEVCFLYGRQQPQVDSADADFDTLGIQMRGVHRMGAAKQEFRGSVYSAGV